MFDINSTYLAFLFIAIILFWRLPTRTAILTSFFGGWLCLPVGHYPLFEISEGHKWWITGLALPADMLISKAWIISTVSISCATCFDMSAVRKFRLEWLDIPMVFWCIWPMFAGLFVDQSSPQPVIAALYITACWGFPWLLGRIWFSTSRGQMAFMKACAWSGVACLPFAVFEGAGIFSVYEYLYEIHPSYADGVERRIGFRPTGLFEHGNQYGIWISLSALAAIWVAAVSQNRVYVAAAILTTIMALIAQSVGAIILFSTGLFILVVWRIKATVPLIIASGCGLLIILSLHLSGIIPLERVIRDTEIGQLTLNTFRSLGLGSFPWRISQELKALTIVQDAFLTGTSVWDWWRPLGTRPWGLWLLVIGQFGIIGFFASYGSLLPGVSRAIFQLRGVNIWREENAALPMALIIILALADSLLNAFLFFPAILAAGSIATKRSPHS